MAFKISAKKGITELQKRYARLGKLGARLRDIMVETRRPLPEEIKRFYQEAAHNYLQFGRGLFDSLKKDGFQVEQIVLRDGKPVKLPDGKLKTLAIDAPLIPSPILTGTLAPISGVGALPLIAAGAVAIGGLVVRVVSSALFKKLVVWIVAGYITIKGLDRLILLVYGPPIENKPIEQAEGYTEVYTKLRADGFTPHQADEKARGIITPPTPHPPSWGSVALGAFAIAATGYAAVKIFGGGKS